MSSWWVKDDTTDTKRTETGGPRKMPRKAGKKMEKKKSKGSHKYNNNVTQPTQNGRVRRGDTMDLGGNIT